MNTQIYEEAAEWLVKHRDGDLGSAEKAQFDAWLRSSPQHVRAYLEMSAIWEDVAALGADSTPDSEQLWALARNEANVFALPAPVASPPRANQPKRSAARATRVERTAASRAGLWGLAALALIAMGAFATWLGWDRNTYVTAIGEQRSLLLSDGSTLELNSRSRVRVRYTKERRDVDLLEGQALFHVAHNAARPFMVHSSSTRVLAVGTQFDVYKKPASTIVTVVDGKVEVMATHPSSTGEDTNAATMHLAPEESRSGAETAIYLAAGQQLTIDTGRSSIARALDTGAGPQPANIAATTAWTQHNLIFESTPLSEVADEFNRYNRRPLVITAPEISGMRISGMFSSADPALFLKFLRAQPELNIEETEREIRISKR